jgi:hypothetical protein
MLNLRKRIKDLQEKTSSLEAQGACKEILENYINLPENQISTSLVEKLKSIGDSDKHVDNFIRITEKVNAVNDLGVARSIAAIKESQIYSYPGLKYGLTKIESSLIFKQVKIVESNGVESKDFKPGDTWSTMNMKNSSFKIEHSNTAGQPEYMLIDATLECLKTFVWDKTVESIYTDLKATREKLSEDIDIAISLNTLKGNGKGSFFFDSIIPKLEEHFSSPTESSRTSIIEDLKKLNYYPAAKALSESLNKIQRSEKGGVQITSDNSKCSISSIYSPILLENETEYFFVKGNYFSKKAGVISKLTEQIETLPENFRKVCKILSSPSVFVKEGKISFYLKKDKVEILENENAVEVRFNGSKVTSTELAKNMVSAGLFRLDESQIAYDVQMVAEQFSNIFDLDFGKIIESTVYPGAYVILMKDNDKIYLNKTNESHKSNEFFSGLNATQARNQILEFIGFDIKESMSEYLEQDDIKLNGFRESQIEIMKSISIVEASLSKIDASLQNEFMASSPELVELKATLESEIIKLKNTHRSIADEIKAFENKSTSDAGYEAGETVKLVESGESATISSVNSTRDSLIVVTASGKTIEVPVDKVTSLDADIAQSNAKNAQEVTEVAEVIDEDNSKKN